MITPKDIAIFSTAFQSFCIHTLQYIINAVKQYFLSFIIVLGLGIGASVFYWSRIIPFYESDMVCEYNNGRIVRKTFGEICQKLNLLAHKGSYNELSKLLDMPVAQTSKILSIDAQNRAGSPLYEDITNDHQSLYFKLKASDRNVFEPFQKALLAYLGNSPYQHQIGDLEVNKLNQKIAYLNADLLKVDSILDSYSIFLKKTGATHDSIGGFSNVAALLTYKDRLEDLRLEKGFKLSLESLPSLTLTHGFAPADTPEKNNKILSFGIILSVLAATCFSILRKLLTERA